MKVYSEAKPSGKTVGVELDENDMADKEGFADLPYAVKHKAMSDRADALLVQYMLRRGDISPEYAEQRMREIVSGQSAG